MAKKQIATPKYEKPKVVERQNLAFPKEIWDKFNSGKYCLQCSGCHGCR